MAGSTAVGCAVVEAAWRRRALQIWCGGGSGGWGSAGGAGRWWQPIMGRCSGVARLGLRSSCEVGGGLMLAVQIHHRSGMAAQAPRGGGGRHWRRGCCGLGGGCLRLVMRQRVAVQGWWWFVLVATVWASAGPCVRRPLAARVVAFLLPGWPGAAPRGPGVDVWAATAWWWLMTVVWVISWRRLDFGIGRSVSALVDLRFLSSSFGRYLHRRVGPLTVVFHRSSRPQQQGRARLAPVSRAELVSRPEAGPDSSRARQQDEPTEERYHQLGSIPCYIDGH